MRTIPEIVAQMRELIEELEQHTGKPAPKEESPRLDFSIYNGMAGNYQVTGTDTISLTGAAGQPTTLYDLKPLTASDLSFFKS